MDVEGAGLVETNRMGATLPLSVSLVTSMPLCTMVLMEAGGVMAQTVLTRGRKSARRRIAKRKMPMKNLTVTRISSPCFTKVIWLRFVGRSSRDARGSSGGGARGGSGPTAASGGRACVRSDARDGCAKQQPSSSSSSNSGGGTLGAEPAAAVEAAVGRPQPFSRRRHLETAQGRVGSAESALVTLALCKPWCMPI